MKAEIAEIEKLTDVLAKTASDSDEVLSRLRQLSGEMQNDMELQTYVQSAIVFEAISIAADALNRGNDTLQSLKNAMLPVAATYQETEQRNKEALSRMTEMMNQVNMGIYSSIVSEQIAPVEHTDAVLSQDKIQQLVSDSVEEMQVTNIAAVKKIVQEEYEIAAIEDLID